MQCVQFVLLVLVHSRNEEEVRKEENTNNKREIGRRTTTTKNKLRPWTTPGEMFGMVVGRACV